MLSTLNFSKNHGVHVDVVRFGKGLRDDLFGEADADFQGIGAGAGKDAVVVAFAAAEASAS